MNQIDIDKLEALAKEATPGPWIPTDTQGREVGLVLTSDNMEYIAAADPTTILALIAEMRRLRAVAEAARELVINGYGWSSPGLWRALGDAIDAIDMADAKDTPS